MCWTVSIDPCSFIFLPSFLSPSPSLLSPFFPLPSSSLPLPLSSLPSPLFPLPSLPSPLFPLLSLLPLSLLPLSFLSPSLLSPFSPLPSPLPTPAFGSEKRSAQTPIQVSTLLATYSCLWVGTENGIIVSFPFTTPIIIAEESGWEVLKVCG